VPWCDTCDRLVPDDELVDDACPTCESPLVDAPRPPVTWKFKLLLVATVIYLIWRFVQGVQWLTHHA
jgi:uncharacterized paraquat-inducible protein A